MRSCVSLILFALGVLFTTQGLYAQDYRIKVVAGVTASNSYGGDGGKASQTAIGNGVGITFLNNGDLAFCQFAVGPGSNRLIGINLEKDSIYTIYGNGGAPSGADDGCFPASSDPSVIPVDLVQVPNGDIYFTELQQHKLRRIEASTQEVCDVMGDGTQEYTGTGTTNAFTAPGSARCFSPVGVRYHDGKIYLAEWTSIRTIDISTGEISLILGNDNAFVGDPSDGTPYLGAWINLRGAFATDPEGNIYFGDLSGNIRMANITTGDLETIVGLTPSSEGYNGDDVGSGEETQIDSPYGMEFGPDGRLYFCDENNGRIRAWDPATDSVITVVGRNSDPADFGPTSTYQMPDNPECVIPDDLIFRPADVTFDDEGTMYIYCNANFQIFKMEEVTKPTVTGFNIDPLVYCPNDTVTITVDGDLGAAENWIWSEECGVTPNLDTNATVSVVVPSGGTSTFYVHGDTTEMCFLDVDCFNVNLEPSCAITNNTITPNGDNLNDFFEIDIIGQYPSNNLYIYNRYGVEVNVIKDYDNIDNIFSGQSANLSELPGGSYYYIFEETDPATGNAIGDVASGWILVLR